MARFFLSYENPLDSNKSSICLIKSSDLLGIWIIIKGFTWISLLMYSSFIAFLLLIAKSNKYSCSLVSTCSFVTFSFMYNALVINPAFITSNSSISIYSASLLVFVVALTLTIYFGLIKSIIASAFTVLLWSSSSTKTINSYPLLLASLTLS